MSSSVGGAHCGCLHRHETQKTDCSYSQHPLECCAAAANLFFLIAFPLCVIHAFDDPLVAWRTVARNEGFMHPDNLSRTGSGNLILLLTKGGGHVGWPIGFLPFGEKWGWMTNAASSFAQAVDQAKKLSVLWHKTKRNN
jgi:hypothetical protein